MEIEEWNADKRWSSG